MVTYKNARELEAMREAGRIVATTLDRLSRAAVPGVTLLELDALAASCIKEHDATSSFLHYHPAWAPTPYPATVCLSVNDAVVHGLPTSAKLKEGDLLSIDCGAVIHGYHGDAAVTVAVGQVDEAAERLLRTTEAALHAGIAQAVIGNRMGDISHAVEQEARNAGYGVLAGCGGHGIGTQMHESPDVPNVGRAGRGMKLRDGLTIAIEPMFHEGGDDYGHTREDGWTVATDDGSRAAHFEHSIAITADGPVILTAL